MKHKYMKKFFAKLPVAEWQLEDGDDVILDIPEFNIGHKSYLYYTAKVSVDGNSIIFKNGRNETIPNNKIKGIWDDDDIIIDDELICGKIQDMVYEYEDCMDLHDALITFFEDGKFLKEKKLDKRGFFFMRKSKELKKHNKK